MKKPTLGPCPFCGSRSTRVLAHQASSYGPHGGCWAQADCKTCGGRGPREVWGRDSPHRPWPETRLALVARAVNGWNGRVNGTELDGL